MAKASSSAFGFTLLCIVSAGLSGCASSPSSAGISTANIPATVWHPPFAYALNIQSDPPSLAHNIAPLLDTTYFAIARSPVPQHLTLTLSGTQRLTPTSPALLGELKPVETTPQLLFTAELRDNLTNTSITTFSETFNGPTQQRMAPSFKPIDNVTYNYTAIATALQQSLIQALTKKAIAPKLIVLAKTDDNQHVIVNLGQNAGLTIGQLFTTEDKSTQCVLVSFEDSAAGPNTRAVLRLRIGSLPSIGTPLMLISS